MSRRRTAWACVAIIMTAIIAATAPVAQANDAPAARPNAPAEKLTAGSALPPGESGDFPILDQVKYEADGNPADFGAHVDDQRQLYWDAKTKPDGFATPTGTPVTPRTGVRIYRDHYGVPLVYGTNGYDVWYGAGYAAATDRLFEMDAIRRTAEGTLAELTGPSQVPADLEEQTLTYTQHEYTQMFHRLSKRGRQAIAGYAAGVEARIAQVRANPTLLPGEYVLLQTLPAPWTINDTMAAGVYITRDIASQGGDEMANVATLRELEHSDGRANGRKVFESLFPENDAKAAVTIHGRSFSNLPEGHRSAAAQHRAFVRAANYAQHLPLTLANGPGTGDSKVPGPSVAHVRSAVSQRIATEVRDTVASIDGWADNLHGGSFAYAVNGKHTKGGHALLVSNPQLGYSYPSELYELEVHGGGYDARGVGVPGMPTVGIGHTATVAWGLTTGYSKTIDSFIETTRANPKKDGPPQYLHDGRWHDEQCRTAHIHYRLAPQGIPVGPADLTENAQICRTDHGPVVATADHGRLARSVDYAMWKQEVQTVDGILRWDRAKTIKDIAAGVHEERMNENVIAADSNGNIGYWHPGRYFRRPPGTDQRFPLNGNGSQDERGYLPFRDMPHVVDPKSDYIANWNTKPARGWVDGDLSGTNTRPAGPANRVRTIQTILARSHGLTRASLTRFDKRIGETDERYLGYRPVIRDLAHLRHLTAKLRRARHLLAAWNGLAYDPGASHGSSPTGTPAADVTDGPAATFFVEFTKKLKQSLFSSLPADARARLDTLSTETHQYDVTPLDNDALRELVPHFSALKALPRWLHGRSRMQVIRRAFVDAYQVMRRTYGANIDSWRRHHGISHIDSLSGVVGPSVEMPFEDRGTWVQEVGFTTGRPHRD